MVNGVRPMSQEAFIVIIRKWLEGAAVVLVHNWFQLVLPENFSLGHLVGPFQTFSHGFNIFSGTVVVGLNDWVIMRIA